LAVSDGKAAVAKAYELSGGAPWLTVPRESERKPELTPGNQLNNHCEANQAQVQQEICDKWSKTRRRGRD
jgi:hypothetical protein